MFKVAKIITQIKEMRVSSIEGQIFRVCDKDSRSTHWLKKIQGNQRLAKINQRKKSTNLLRICQLQSQIHKGLFKKDYIFDQFND